MSAPRSVESGPEDTLSCCGTIVAPTSHFASALGGGTAGINWQTGHWVLGLEGDYSWTGINSTVNFGCGPAACYEKMSYFATARGRAGYAADRFLYFVSSGAAFSKSATVQAGVDSGTGQIHGWTVGAGVEAAIDNHWSVKAEYLYADFGKPTFDDVGVPVTHDIKDNIVRIGLNYSFGPWWTH